MKTYEVEVVVHYKFLVTAESPYEAYQEAQEYDEYFTDSQVERIVISENDTELITY
jgi:hypothetical protein